VALKGLTNQILN